MPVFTGLLASSVSELMSPLSGVCAGLFLGEEAGGLLGIPPESSGAGLCPAVDSWLDSRELRAALCRVGSSAASPRSTC